ncbi:MAG: transposase [Saprospiraceae bacterium]|nr:transposase [Saprospiraceae bacterium]
MNFRHIQQTLCNYNIFITNIPKEQLAAHKMFEIYSLRWSIELMFKEWKSIFDLNALMLSNKTPNPARPRNVIIFDAIIYCIGSQASIL